MSQERLNDLAILCIEKDVIELLMLTQLLVTLHIEMLIGIVLYEHLNIKEKTQCIMYEF
jgi:hypothetical protein